MKAKLTQAHQEHQCVICGEKIEFAKMYVRTRRQKMHQGCAGLVAQIESGSPVPVVGRR
jgi:hypothetical protein